MNASVPDRAETGRNNRKVGDYWSSVEESGAFSPSVYWLANPLVQRRYQQKAAGGREYAHWLNFCVEAYLERDFPHGKILSVGCGNGSLERHLACLTSFAQIDAIDIAPGLIEEARTLASREGITGINYVLGNAEEEPFPNHDYDAVFFNGSLHHMESPDQTLRKTANALRRDGYLFLNEYTGPNRFEFSEREKEIIDSLYRLIPERFRASLEEGRPGCLRNSVQFPDPAEVARVDPSESVCSAEIVPNLGKYFEVIEFNKTGGTVLQFLLQNIAGHFREDDPQSLRILELLFEAEDTLIEVGELESHFAVVVARRKPGQSYENDFDSFP